MARFVLSTDLIARILDEEPSLHTIKVQLSLEEIWALLEGKDDITSEEDLYNALMSVMYDTRPKGVT